MSRDLNRQPLTQLMLTIQLADSTVYFSYLGCSLCPLVE